MIRSKPSGITKKRIYVELRRPIIIGQREPGERLDLGALASSYGASATPARDVLQMLSQEGLVIIKPRSGHSHPIHRETIGRPVRTARDSGSGSQAGEAG